MKRGKENVDIIGFLRQRIEQGVHKWRITDEHVERSSILPVFREVHNKMYEIFYICQTGKI